ncbi:hypothetical protein C8R44DRAFT_866555 [Mycena epipterygia]|nr:hypothetical protein C8R44DRAFT_866555 [Mycena epipterygia]
MKRGGWSMGSFLEKLFVVPPRGEPGRSPRHAEAVSSFLRSAEHEKVHADRIVELIYFNKDSAPKAVPNTSSQPVEKVRPDASRMARHLLSEWAIRKVEGFVGTASQEISSKEGGFHLTREQTTWDFLRGFSLAKAILPNEQKGAVLLRVLAAAALPAALSEALRPSVQNPAPYFTHLSRPAPPGSGANRKDPLVIIVITFLMLMYARNLHFSVLRKLAGIWLFANNASASIFTVLSRIGLSSSYTTRSWDPDLGQRDNMDSGTAATFIELMNCNVGKAFDPKALKDARDAGVRGKLTTQVLLERIDMPELSALMALHCISFLIADTPVLAPHQAFINLRFRTTHAKHRMPDGYVTSIHPLAIRKQTSDQGYPEA